MLPPEAEAPYETFEYGHHISRGSDVSWTEKGGQEITPFAIEDEQWVVHMLIIEAIEKGKLLRPVGGVIGTVDIEDDALGGFREFAQRIGPG